MDYRESRAFVDEAAVYGSVLGLDNMTELMKRLGNAQDRYKTVHVAGTNGKGSVIAFLSSVLSEAGFTVGRYNSPAIFSYRERFQVSEKWISHEDFARCTGIVAKAISDMVSEGYNHPTVFEIETAIAFVWFERKKCDIVLVETGMGGDLDATNVISAPLLSVITSIGFDHMEYLGNTLREIAGKKAGIIKPGCRMIGAAQEKEAEEVLRRACKEKKVDYCTADPSGAEVIEESCEGQTFIFEGHKYQIGLPGVYQIQNAVLALKALDILGEEGFSSSLEERKKGLLRTAWRGRFTVLQREPYFIMDGAHNSPAAEILRKTLQRYFPEHGHPMAGDAGSEENEGSRKGRFIFIIGMFKDKDYRTVLKIMCPMADMVYAIETPENRRALPAEKLCDEAKRFCPGGKVKAAGSIGEAVENALDEAGQNDVIVAFGSLSFLSVLEKEVLRHNSDGRLMLETVQQMN